MPVNTPHPDYSVSLAAWSRITTCLQGSDAVKAAATRFLPRLVGQDDEAYAKYLFRANFFNATGRAHEAMLGFLFRKHPAIEKPAGALEDLTEDADLSGAPLLSYARQVCYAVAGTGRACTVIDWSSDETRPYFAFYPETSIINWRSERIGGKNRLTLLVLREATIEGTGTDIYEPSLTIHFREFRLIDGKAYVQLWRQEQQGTAQAHTTAPGTGTGGHAGPVRVGEPIELNRRSVPLDFIPVVFHGSETTADAVDKPPLSDLSAVNISHFQSSADLENGRHVCGTPTAYALGFEAGDKMYLGSSHAWTTENTDAKCGWLEFSGVGLGALEKAIEEKQSQMAALGARLVEPRQADAEAYETVQLRASAETSTLARIALLTGEGLSRAMRIADWWAGTATELNEEITFEFNTDFSSVGIRAEMLTALTTAVNQGMLSRDTLYYQLQRGEMYPEGWTMEEEQDAIDANPPMPPMPPGGGLPPGPGGPPDPGTKPPVKPPVKKAPPKAA